MCEKIYTGWFFMEQECNVVYYMIKKVSAGNRKEQTEIARRILKYMLDYLSYEFTDIEISENGKPYFANSDIYFNYSHSKNYIACAVSNHEVGIDIEETTRYITNRVSKKYLENENESDKKLEKWVKKEAYSKLKGLGLLMNFQTINLDEISNKNLLISNGDYVCSIYSDCEDAVFKEVPIGYRNFSHNV